MSDFEPELFDLIRAHAERRLVPQDASRLARLTESDPELAALIEDFVAVHAVTAVGEEGVPETQTRFEDVRGRFFPGRRWVAAAAALLLVTTGWAFFYSGLQDKILGADPPGSGGSSGVPVFELAAIRLSPSVPTSAFEAFPAVLESFRPVVDGEMRWMDSVEEAREVARVVGRPVLFYLSHPTCPWCMEMDEDTFTEGGVQTAVEDFVPVRIDVTTLPSDEAIGYFREGWPYLEAQDGEGDRISFFPGRHDVVQMRGHLDAALEAAGGAERLPWVQVNAIASQLASARKAENEGRMGDAMAGYHSAAGADPRGRLGRVGVAGGERIAASAGRALVDAQQMARVDPADAERQLEAAVLKFVGTAYGRDLEGALALLREAGRFPELKEMPH